MTVRCDSWVAHSSPRLACVGDISTANDSPFRHYAIGIKEQVDRHQAGAIT